METAGNSWETDMRFSYNLIWSKLKNNDMIGNISDNTVDRLKAVRWKVSIDSSEDNFVIYLRNRGRRSRHSNNFSGLLLIYLLNPFLFYLRVPRWFLLSTQLRDGCVCQPYAPVALHFQEKSLVLISLRGWVELRAKFRLEEWGQLKKYSNFIWNWNRHLPACNIVPQSTTPQPALVKNAQNIHWLLITYYDFSILAGLTVVEFK
jgi:hypothetical protein